MLRFFLIILLGVVGGIISTLAVGELTKPNITGEWVVENINGDLVTIKVDKKYITLTTDIDDVSKLEYTARYQGNWVLINIVDEGLNPNGVTLLFEGDSNELKMLSPRVKEDFAVLKRKTLNKTVEKKAK